MSDFVIDGMLAATYKEPGAALTARARHRRHHLPCGNDLTKQLLAIVEQYGWPDMRDGRHRQTAAWPDLSDYLDELAFEGKRPRTLDTYERTIAALLVENPETAFGEFDKTLVMRALGRVPRQSRHICKSILNGWFAWGVREDRLDRNPVDKIRKITPGPTRPSNVFTAEEIAVLVARPDGALWGLLFGTGLRREDAIKLQRGHIDLERMRLAIFDGKGGKNATIPFGPDLAALLADLDLIERLEPDDYLWRRTHYQTSRKHPVGRTTFGRWYKAELATAGIPYRNPHQTRHTFHWILRHVEKLDLEERQMLMRHDSPVTTVRQYGVVDLEEIAAKRAKVSSL